MEHAETMSDTLARNLRETRTRRGLTVQQVADRLAGDIAYPVVRSSISKTEASDPVKRRAVSVDDLGALALALDTSPWFLLSPRVPGQLVNVTPGCSWDAEAVSQWLRGQAHLTRDEDASAIDREQAAREDAPPWARSEYGRPDDRLWPINTLRAAVEREVNGTPGPHTPGQRAAMLRREMKAVQAAVGLMVARLDAEDGS